MNRYIAILVILLFPIVVIGQENIGGSTLNTYYSVEATSGANSITCKSTENLSTLSRGDKVLLIQMSGAMFDPFVEEASGTIFPNSIYNQATNQEGKYEFLSVLSVNNTTKEIVFTANLENAYTAGEKIQLVKVYEAFEATVTSELSAPDWDSASGKGGVLAMVILRKLTLNADINLNGKGFGGAEPTPYLIDCRPSSSVDTMYYYAGSVNKGGIKGEGLKSTSTNYIIGPGNNFNGGGGGIGKFGGGGGGSNYDRGGAGGAQQESCLSHDYQLAKGGIGLETGNYGSSSVFGSFYNSYSKITFGGGGGGSTYSPGLSATKGGDGGGMLFILVDTLVGNGGAININGESVTGTATAGAGGGGAGGTFLLDVAVCTGLSIPTNLQGGDGGNSSGVTDCGGAGGSGAGGVILNSSASISGLITTNVLAGSSGTSECSTALPTNGLSGAVINNYEPLLNGFTFNAITGIDTICNGQIPNELIGTVPKGATNFAYQWLVSTDNNSWTAIPGATSKDYQPTALTDTTYYTREVNFPDAGIRDTAISVQIMVYPDIIDNILTLRDTVCDGVQPGILSAVAVSGGDGVSYNYRWESTTDQSGSWTHRGDLTTELLNETNALSQTTYYQRHVESGSGGVCYSPSNIDTITVIPAIVGNGFENLIDTIICNGLEAGLIVGTSTTGGDGAPHRYSWLSSSNGITYADIASEISKNYNPGPLTSTMYYKRIVYSGEGNACIDTTTTPRKVEVLATITENIINSDSTRYCSGDTLLELKQDPGFTLAGGNGSYDYQWQQYNGSVWSDIPGADAVNFLPGVLTDTSTYRRVVSSGPIETIFACVDESPMLTIDVIPSLSNSLSSADQTICQGVQPIVFAEGNASGGAGAGTYIYQWQQNTNGAGWIAATGTNNTASYDAPILYAPTEYRRLVSSHICDHYSDTVIIEVIDSIRENSILGANVQYTCYNSPIEVAGSQPLGGVDGITFNYLWENSDDGNTWSNAGGTQQSFASPDLTLATYYRRIVQSGTGNVCKDTSNMVLAEINQLPTGDIVSKLDTVCAGEEIIIAYANLTGNGNWKIELGESTVLHTESDIISPNGDITFPLEASANIEVISIVDDSLCIADLTTNTGLVEAMVYEVPSALAETDFEECGLEVQLNASLSTSGFGIWTSDEGSFDDPTLPNATVTMDSYDLKTLRWTEYNWECKDSIDISFTLYEQPFEADAGEDQDLPYVLFTNLDATPPAITSATGYWQFILGTGTLEDSTQTNTRVEMDGLGEYMLRWTIENGVCEPVSDSMKISIGDLELNNGFSPNGDGTNDDYSLLFPSGNPVKFTILDRNGNVVRILQAINNKVSWDGTNESGQQVPEDTYFYILEEEGWPTVRTGYIDLRR